MSSTPSQLVSVSFIFSLCCCMENWEQPLYNCPPTIGHEMVGVTLVTRSGFYDFASDFSLRSSIILGLCEIGKSICYICNYTIVNVHVSDCPTVYPSVMKQTLHTLASILHFVTLKFLSLFKIPLNLTVQLKSWVILQHFM